MLQLLRLLSAFIQSSSPIYFLLQSRRITLISEFLGKHCLSGRIWNWIRQDLELFLVSCLCLSSKIKEPFQGKDLQGLVALPHPSPSRLMGSLLWAVIELPLNFSGHTPKANYTLNDLPACLLSPCATEALLHSYLSFTKCLDQCFRHSCLLRTIKFSYIFICIIDKERKSEGEGRRRKEICKSMQIYRYMYILVLFLCFICFSCDASMFSAMNMSGS